jgi:patatin-like phospholipase/acyl hydrolase
MSKNSVTLEALQEEIRILKESNERLEKAFMAVSMIMEKQQSVKEFAKKDSLTREFERKLRKSRPHVLKDKIRRYFEENTHTDLADAKFYFVDQMNYTSKATFYRYIGELTKENLIAKSQKGNITIISPIAEQIKKNSF